MTTCPSFNAESLPGIPQAYWNIEEGVQEFTQLNKLMLVVWNEGYRTVPKYPDGEGKRG
jgi:hypothetical protein